MIEQAVLYPQVAVPVGTTDDWTEPLDSVEWTQPFSEPVLPIKFRHLLPSVFYEGEPGTFVEPYSDELMVTWLRPIDQPTYRPEYRYMMPFLWYQGDPADFVEPPEPAAANKDRPMYSMGGVMVAQRR